MGAGRPVSHWKDRASRGTAPAARPTSHQGLADARSRAHAEHFAGALAARRLRCGRASDLLEFRAVHGRTADAIRVRYSLRHDLVALRQSMEGTFDPRPARRLP